MYASTGAAADDVDSDHDRNHTLTRASSTASGPWIVQMAATSRVRPPCITVCKITYSQTTLARTSPGRHIPQYTPIGQAGQMDRIAITSVTRSSINTLRTRYDKRRPRQIQSVLIIFSTAAPSSTVISVQNVSQSLALSSILRSGESVAHHEDVRMAGGLSPDDLTNMTPVSLSVSVFTPTSEESKIYHTQR